MNNSELWLRFRNLEKITDNSNFYVMKSINDNVVETYRSDKNENINFEYDVNLGYNTINRMFILFKQDYKKLELINIKIPKNYFNILLEEIKEEEKKKE